MRSRVPFLLRLAAVACTMALASSLAAPVQATGATLRLSGSFQVKETVTASHNGDAVGHVFRHRKFRFAPTCKNGACKSVMTRFRQDGTKVTYATHPQADGTYTGSTTYPGACFLRNGGTVANAYHYRESVVVRPAAPSGTSAASFKGTLRLVFTPTAIGNNHNCTKGSESLKLSGVKQ
jgi:hypothetical protein